MNTSVWEKGETRRIAEVALSNQPPKLVIPNGFSHEKSAFFYLQTNSRFLTAKAVRNDTVVKKWIWLTTDY
jgi:hypothetical protein